MLTNKQMFDNILDPIPYKDQIEDYHHYIFEMPPKMQQKILLFYAIGLFVFLILYDFLRKIFKACIEFEDEKEIEELSPFSDSLNVIDKYTIFKEEKHRREKHGYKLLFDNLYSKLSNSLGDDKFELGNEISESDPNIYYITDAISYDLLDQSDYSYKFSYVPAYKRRSDQQSINYDSEFTRLILEYPYHRDIDSIKYISKKSTENIEY